MQCGYALSQIGVKVVELLSLFGEALHLDRAVSLGLWQTLSRATLNHEH